MDPARHKNNNRGPHYERFQSSRQWTFLACALQQIILPLMSHENHLPLFLQASPVQIATYPIVVSFEARV